MKQRTSKSLLQIVRPKLALILCMVLIGSFTAYASANTYEVVSRHDIPFSSVITTVQLTNDPVYNVGLQQASKSSFNDGDFGIPQKMKLPETRQHIDITSAYRNDHGWLASQGMAQTFVTASQRQKVFGEAVIYARYNTPTTQHLGDVLNGDVVNIVTTDGWQLGYQVTDTASDPSQLPNVQTDKSQIVVILVNDHDQSVTSFQASLVKVGERV